MAEFDFYLDQKHTIWYRGKFQIEAETYEEAVAKVKEMEQDQMKYDEVDVRWDEIESTLEGLTPEDNDGQTTNEVYSADTSDLIYANAEGRDPIKM
mgnify:CR=1 FL=1